MTTARARQVPVRGNLPYDYADAFEVGLSEVDGRSAEEFARCALEQSPAFIRSTIWFVHKHVIRFRLAPRGDRAHVMGWTIVASDNESVQLKAVSPVLQAVLVAERPEPTRAVVTTYLLFRRPALARLLWTFVGPLHRSVARYLLEHTASSEAVMVG